MNIYDFDDTIFDGDSSLKFIKYSLIRHPLKVSLSIVLAIKEGIKYLFHKSTFGQIKSELFSFVKYIDNLEDYMEKYVLKHQKNIKNFYLENKKDNDVIISASFDFIVRPFCEKMGIKYIIATKYDTKKGQIIGKNCKGQEKIIRLKEVFENPKVNEAYSDSLSDIPMLEIANNAYLVKGNELIKYKK